MAKTLANGMLFNLAWFAIVYSASDSVAIIIALVFVALHLLVLGKGVAELRLIVGVTVMGVALDQLLFLAGVFTVGGVAASAPLWLSALWPVLATTLMHAFAGLRQRWVLAALLGAVGGSLSYTAGTRLTEVDFASPVYSVAIIAVLWALLMPALVYWGQRLDPEAQQARP
jgi:hypothetical protein